VLRPAIRRNVKLAEAPSFGKTIFDYEPWCPGALDYRMLARELLAAWGWPTADDSAKRQASPGANPSQGLPAMIESKTVPEVVIASAGMPVPSTSGS
jgi:hypothetical protein